MKKFILGYLIVYSFAVMASCPDLQGSYPLCKTESGADDSYQSFVIEQKDVNGVTHYNISYLDVEAEESIRINLVTDGTLETSMDENGAIKQTQAMCESDLLLMKETVTYEDVKVYSSTRFVKDGDELLVHLTADLRDLGAGVQRTLSVCK